MLGTMLGDVAIKWATDVIPALTKHVLVGET